MNETIGELVERLIQLKKDYDIYYPDDNIINVACNILDQLPREMIISDWIQNKKTIDK
jgi:hypothetical protein